jgi:hypothetical protein
MGGGAGANGGERKGETRREDREGRKTGWRYEGT